MAGTDTLEYEWRIEQGEREVLIFPVMSGNDPFPIVGWSADCVIKDRPGGNALYTFPPEYAAVSSDGLTVALTVPAPISAAWLFRAGWWRLKVANPDFELNDPDVQRIAQGSLTVVPD